MITMLRGNQRCKDGVGSDRWEEISPTDGRTERRRKYEVFPEFENFHGY